MATEDNISPLCELLSLLHLPMKNIENVPYGRSCLRPTNSRNYAAADGLDAPTIAKLSGVVLLVDRDTGNFVNVVRAESIKTALSNLEEKARSVIYPSAFARYYPHSDIANDVESKGGEARGTFQSLDKVIAFAIDPALSNVLTRRSGGLFVWTEETISNLNEMKGGGASLEERQLKLVIGMLSLSLSLLLDIDNNLSESCFMETFMGSTFTLMTSV